MLSNKVRVRARIDFCDEEGMENLWRPYMCSALLNLTDRDDFDRRIKDWLKSIGLLATNVCYHHEKWEEESCQDNGSNYTATTTEGG